MLLCCNKWRIFYYPINVHESFAETIIKTCCLLHNFVMERDGYRSEDRISIHGLLGAMPVDSSQPGNAATCVRAVLTEYFMNDGELA